MDEYYIQTKVYDSEEEDRKLELQERKAKIKQMNQPKVAPSDKKETTNVK